MDTKPCKICGKVMERGYRTKAYFETRKFCSQVCYHRSDDSKAGKYKEGHEGLPGSLNPSWKGGVINHHSGYKRVSIGKRKYKLLHRKVMEDHLGRSLSDEEQVHHINGDKSDNNLSNLQVISSEEHGRLHGKQSVQLPNHPNNRKKLGIR